MSIRWVRRGVWGGAIALLASIVWAAPAPKVAPGPSTSERPLDDAWLGRAALDELQQAFAQGRLTELKGRMTGAILGRLACGRLDQLESVNAMFYVIQACRYLPMAREVGDDAFAKWLTDNRSLSRLLFRALDDVKSPRDSLKVLHELYQADPNASLEYANLSVAFATSKPHQRHESKPAPTSTLLDGFRWYTDPKQAFRYPLRNMPYELARYLTDTRLSTAERQWAVQNYGQSADLARSYHDLKYDYDYYKKDTPKKISKLEYTLPNLRQVGGVCIEQAYYASQICKALGVPATIVSGEGASGIHHAWVACLKISRDGQQAVWDCTTGRYESQLYFTGVVRDPTDGGQMQDSELMLSGAAAQLELARREEAHAATAMAVMIERDLGKLAEPDLTEITALATSYAKQLAGRSDAPKADVSQFRIARKLDSSLAEDLLYVAVRKNLAHQPAWDAIENLCKSGRLPVDRLDRFFDLLVDRTAKQFPDYSANMVLRIVSRIASAQRQGQVLERALAVYGARPDLQGRILIALGDAQVAQGQKDKAYNTYEQAATKCTNVSEVVVTAADKAEKLLRSAGPKGLDAAIKVYTKLFGMTKPSKSAVSIRAQSSHYQLGKRLADLLTEAGRDAEARQLLKKIEE
jgi:hypothetical protein